jgi:chromosome segregation protein
LYLKRIELLGFKSFGQKAEIEFQRGITAIVGPNGCGKSNIVDSFRWVLGEQSIKSLRGTKMEDVIFNGTSTRKPLGIAEVSLTFDNEDGFINLDFKEVTVTRRIYRSGESEYLINKRPCRLKDIQGIFMDTGIGKEAYSIMSQGKVDALLSNRPEERRTVFEEAAGILKYRNRKREAERRLQETEDNILRIGDVVAELEVQVIPLAEQAAVARQYLQLKGRLDKLVTSLLYADARTLESKLARLREALAGGEGKISDHAGRLTGEEGWLTSKRWELEKRTEEMQELQKKVYDLNEERERVRGETELVRERLKGNEGRLAKNRKEEARVREEIDGAARLVAELRDKEVLLQEEIKAQNGKLARLEEKRRGEEERSGAEEAVSLEGMRRSLEEEHYKLESSLAALEVKKTFLQDRLELINQQSESLVLEKYRINNSLSLKSGEQETLMLEGQKRGEELAAIQAERRHLQGEIEKQERKLAALREEARAVLEKHKTLQELDSSFAGYFQGVRNLLLAKKAGEAEVRGIHGAVADLISVEEKYRTAVETALAGSLQDLVVEDEGSVREAISYLKKNRLGRATFLPLTVIKGNLPDQERLPRDIMGLAVDLVQCEPRYQQIMNSLLGRVLVCADLPAAQKAAREASFRYKVVTLQGEVIYAGGAVTGGSSRKNDTYLLARKQEIEALAEKKTALQAELQALMASAAALRERETAAQESEKQQQARVGQIKTRVFEGASRIEALKAEGISVARRVEENKKSQRRAAADLKEAKENEETLKYAMARIQAEMSRLEAKIRLVKERLASGQDVLTGLQEKITAVKISRAGSEEKLRSILEKLQDVQEGAENKGREIEKIGQECKEYQEEGKLLEESLVAWEERMAALDGDRDGLVSRLSTVKEGQESLKLDCMAKEGEIKEIRDKLLDLKKEQAQVEIQEVRVDAELTALQVKLKEEYNLDFSEVAREDMVSMNKGAMRSGIEELREEIAALGPVNTGAIQESERIGQRIAFLREQKEDLLAGQISLQKIIHEIDHKMGQKFLKTFDHINKEFNEVFKRLFGGGAAYLELVDKEAPLESGIEIIAKPPGKKMQMISLLSGGERALTAISLLFALMLVKPAPFCVLDEIDTSLDDSNVERYCNYLKELDRKVQFVLVTHKKQTMKIADILYGVTMEEAGISKLISMKMREKAV